VSLTSRASTDLRVVRPAPDPSTVRIPGPWAHRDVSANGIRIHIAEAGSGPLVVLLHGFPEFWWAWRRQLTALSDAGYRAVAVDLRGYGDSDKPPRGYDGWTLAGDVAGLIKALGASRAHVVGHAWGGMIAWTVAALHPRLVASVSALAAPHPLALRAAVRKGLFRRSDSQAAAIAQVFRAQLPIGPERGLVAEDAAVVERLLRQWGGPRWTVSPEFAEVADADRAAMRVPGVAHSSMEYFRWALRSQLRGDGHRFADELDRRLTVPALQVHGSADPYLLESTARASREWLAPGVTYRSLTGIGHFPHHEAPDTVNDLLLEFLAAQSRQG
jgi:pimeloyl-ACP methyl ester carboxylesterase